MPSDWHLETLAQPCSSHNLGPCPALVRVLGQTPSVQGTRTNHFPAQELGLGICGMRGFHEGSELVANCAYTLTQKREPEPCLLLRGHRGWPEPEP